MVQSGQPTFRVRRAYTQGVASDHPLRRQFEVERRTAAFLGALPAIGVGIIAIDTWVGPWAAIPGGLAAGAVGYALVYGYETVMWRREHG